MFVEGSMTRRASPDDALAVLREVGADIVVVPEFGVFERMSEKTSSAIAALGYTMEQFVYGDERGHGTGLAILSRLPIESRQRIAMNEFKGAPEVVVAREHQNIRIIGNRERIASPVPCQRSSP
jgi:endonuclease/exonuclease/phosphatase family metal-dependent hydrolase